MLAAALEGATDDHLRCVAATKLAATLHMALRRPGDAIAVLEKAKAAATDPARIAELDAQIANIDGLSGRPAAALARMAPLLDSVDERVLRAVAVAVGPALTVAGRAADAVALADRTLSGPLAAGQRDALADIFVQLANKAFALGELGRLAEAETLSMDCYQAAVGVKSVGGQAWGAMLRGKTALLLGRPKTASAAFAEGAALFEETGELALARWCVAGLALRACGGDRRQRPPHQWMPSSASDRAR